MNDNNKPIPEINPPEINAQFGDNNVLIRITCVIQKGVFSKITMKIEDCHLFITNMNVVPINGNISHITIVAEMESDFSMSQEDLVTDLHSIFL